MANYITLATSVNTRLQPVSSLSECKCTVEVAADEMLAHLLATYRHRRRRRRAIRDAVLSEMELGSVPFGVNKQTNTQDDEEEEDGGRRPQRERRRLAVHLNAGQAECVWCCCITAAA